MRTLKQAIKYIEQVYFHTTRDDPRTGQHYTRSWREAARRISKESGLTISAGTLIRVASGYEPKDERVRRALDLPVYVTLQVCRKCGNVHKQRRACVAKDDRIEMAKLRIADLPSDILAWKLRNRIEWSEE